MQFPERLDNPAQACRCCEGGWFGSRPGGGCGAADATNVGIISDSVPDVYLQALWARTAVLAARLRRGGSLVRQTGLLRASLTCALAAGDIVIIPVNHVNIAVRGNPGR